MNSYFVPGYASEEGAEHNNKKIRYYRDHHSVTTCPADNLKSFFLRQTYISDPVINNEIKKIVRVNMKPRSDLPDRIKAILKDSPRLGTVMEQDVAEDAPTTSFSGDFVISDELPQLEEDIVLENSNIIPDDEVAEEPFDPSLLFEDQEDTVEIVAVTDFLDDIPFIIM